jgi:hypothetical protein
MMTRYLSQALNALMFALLAIATAYHQLNLPWGW